MAVVTVRGDFSDISQKIVDLNIDLQTLKGNWERSASGLYIPESSVASVGKLGKNSRLASSTLMQLGRGVQDARYGIAGLANNVEVAVEQFTMLRGRAGSLGGAFSAMGKSLLGPAGILLGFSVGSVLLQEWIERSKEAKGTTDALTESLDSLISFDDEEVKFDPVSTEAYARALGEASVELDTQKRIAKSLSDDLESVRIAAGATAGSQRDVIRANEIAAAGSFKDLQRQKEIQDDIVKKKQGVVDALQARLDKRNELVETQNLLKDAGFKVKKELDDEEKAWQKVLKKHGEFREAVPLREMDRFDEALERRIRNVRKLAEVTPDVSPDQAEALLRAQDFRARLEAGSQELRGSGVSSEAVDEGTKALEVQISKVGELRAAMLELGITTSNNFEAIGHVGTAVAGGFADAFMSAFRATGGESERMLANYKKVAIAEALINTYASVTRTMRQYPFPFNIPMAAAALAQGYAMVQSIRSTTTSSSGGSASLGAGPSAASSTIGPFIGGRAVVNDSAPEGMRAALDGPTGPASSTVQVQGTARMDRQDFVIDFENARKDVNRNVGLQ